MSRKIFGLMSFNVYAPSFVALYFKKKLQSTANEKLQLEELKPEFIKPSFRDILFVAMPVVNAALFKNKINRNHTYSCSNRQELYDDANTHPTVQSVNEYMDKAGIKLSDFVLNLIKKSGEIVLYSIPKPVLFRFAINNHKALKYTKSEEKISKAFLIDARLIQYDFLKSSAPQLPKQEYKELCANYAGIYLHSILATIKQAFIFQVIFADMFSNGLDSGVSLDYYLSKSAQLKLLDTIQKKLEFGMTLLMVLNQQNLTEAERQYYREQFQANEKKLQKLCDYFRHSETKQFKEDNLPKNQLSDLEQDIEPNTIQGTNDFIQQVEELDSKPIENTLSIKPVFHSYGLFAAKQSQTNPPASCAEMMNDFMQTLNKSICVRK